MTQWRRSCQAGKPLASLLVSLLLCGGLNSAYAAGSAHGAITAVLPGKVTRVIDGDTIDVLLTSGVIRVRLHGIDAPEHKGPFRDYRQSAAADCQRDIGH